MRTFRRTPRRHLFLAKSPKTGTIRQFEGLVQLGTIGPYAIVTADQGEAEKYSPEDEGFEELLGEYRKGYPADS